MKKTSGLNLTRYSSPRQKQQKKQVAAAVGVGLCVMVIVIPLLETKYGHGFVQRTIACLLPNNNHPRTGYKSEKTVLSLALIPPAQRAGELEAIANGVKSRESARARYLLASDLLAQQQGQKAADLLERLECDYSLLAPHIRVKRAQAYESIADKAKATEEWEKLLQYFPDSPVAAEALFALGKKNREDWKDVIAKYPTHPRTQEMVRLWLQDNPNQRDLLLLLTKNGFDTPGISEVLDKLVSLPSSIEGKPVEPLKPEDWEMIAQGYWKDKKYKQASAAYAKAAPTSRNAYLVAKALQLAERRTDANLAYKKMVKSFPDGKETGIALLEIGKIEPSIEAVPYLDQVINKFPDQAPEALLVQAEALDHLNNSQAAAQARELLLNKYGNSDAAAEYRWNMAQKEANAGNVEAAFQWAQQILNQSPNSDRARQAGFWAGKWALQLGKQEEAKAIFQQVVTKYTQSYYAWRSARFLGWDVGDFTNLRQMKPEVVGLTELPLLPIGSAALKELYQLDQDQDASTLWQAEFQNRQKPTVAEQFTDGLIKEAVGDYISGIDQIAKLEDRETPAEQAEFQSLKQQPIYWYALYPFPYLETIQTWSPKRQMNPLLVVSLMRQESRFMPTIKSSAGAVGLMQVMPAVGAEVARSIDLKEYSLENPNDNINLGTSFMAFSHQRYKDNSLLALASYNGGAGNVGQWVAKEPLNDPDQFVENIPFPETRDYVKQVLGNYWNYSRLYNPSIRQLVTEQGVTLK